TIYLSSYAALHVKDELARVAGVADIAGFGQRDYSMRVWLDPEKMRARKLSAGDVMEAIRRQNVQVAAGHIGRPSLPPGKDFQFKLPAGGKLKDAEEFENLLIKTDDKGVKIYLRDLGRIELAAAATDSYVTLNGKPGVLLCIYPTGAGKPEDLSRAVADKIAKLRGRAPEGLQLEVAFDFAANLHAADGPKASEYLLLDVHFPDGTSLERKRGTLGRCEKMFRDVPGVQDVLALTDSPFDMILSQPCVLVRL